MHRLCDINHLKPILERYAPETGYSFQMLEWGFAHLFAHWNMHEFCVFAMQEIPGFDADNAAALFDIDTELQERCRIVPEPAVRNVLIVSASTVPSAVFGDVVLSLLMPVEVGLRPSQNLLPLFRELADYLRVKAPKLAKRLVIYETGHDDDALKELLQHHDLVLVSGSESTMMHYRMLMDDLPACERPGLVEHGHKISAISMSARDLAALTEDDLSAIALDASVWDQTGCLSPKCLFVEADFESCVELAQELAKKLDEIALKLPALPMDIAESVARNNGLCMAQFDGAKIIKAQNNGDRIVVFPENASFKPLLYPRTLSIYPVADGVESAMQLAPYGQAMGMREVPDSKTEQKLRTAGYNYFCRFGQMQDPPLSWFHDEVGTVRPFFA